MEYRKLGKSALKVSTLCLGTMNFGPRTSEEESFAIMNDAMEAGIIFLILQINMAENWELVQQKQLLASG